MARPPAPRRRPRDHRHGPDQASVPSLRAFVANTSARAFGIVVVVGALAATFGGWIATLR